jgi:dolichyl-diphosphooligosaccharide--protein glycosyltransferase
MFKEITDMGKFFLIMLFYVIFLSFNLVDTPYQLLIGIILTVILVFIFRFKLKRIVIIGTWFFFLSLLYISIPVSENWIITAFLSVFHFLVYLLFKKQENHTLKAIGIFVAFAMLFMFSMVTAESQIVSKYSTPVLSNNWWEALNWIKNNTEKCAVIATYWDPGHFITAIAERPVVFDGASQNELITVEINGTNVTTARIQDIATTLYTDNETRALEILKKYRGNCSEMYYIASSDLIMKSQWWTYFSTWNPIDKGTKIYYGLAQLSGKRPLKEEQVIAYLYFVGRDERGIEHYYLLYEKNGTIIPMYQVGNQFIKIRKITFYLNGSLYNIEYSDADIEGTLLAFSGFQGVVYIPKELENSLFTRMFFYNGHGLENFEFVRDWGGEVKLFKVLFNQTN